ncbi:hypothetical protein K1X12_05785 [Hyphomonas sp. WL0036]|uniref:hypothetical protein n=1 Tax=Hyphomonas sediminis TaxID=2866160 RepID=UPI001C7FCE12|nr:hypothetical protein [Hyphomonas sediminis]MBY9066399.1 hypothetical protein [Hyphomonas sediminis]
MTFRALLLFAAIAFLPGIARGETVLWQIAPQLSSGAVTGLDLTLTFPGDEDGETALSLPDRWGGEAQLYLGLDAITAEGGEILPASSPAGLILHHAPGAQITLHWKVPSAGKGPPDSKQGRGNDYRPRFSSDYFFLLGHTVLIRPEHLPDDTPVRMDLTAFSQSGIPFVSDLEHGTHGRAMDLGDLHSSVLFGGGIRIIDAGNGGRLALTGKLDHITDEEWKSSFVHISADQRAYWQTEDEPFLVTVIASDMGPRAMSIGGTGLGDAFALFVSQNMDLDTGLPVIAHEMIHSWVPGRIGRMPEENDAGAYWLSEGFTDWTTFRTLARGGHWSPERFAEGFNRSLSAYDLSDYRNAPNTAIIRDFWTTPEIGDLPYQRGMLIATWLDAGVRARTQGNKDFDDILLAMQAASRAAPNAQATDLLLAALLEESGWDARSAIEQMAEAGNDIPLAEDTFAPCGVIITESKPVWERGFNFEATRRAGWIIQGVKRNSAAWAAGLRNGMHITNWSETSQDRLNPTEKTATVSLAGTSADITWLPIAAEPRPVRRLKIFEDLSPEAADGCRKRLAGL